MPTPVKIFPHKLFVNLVNNSSGFAFVEITARKTQKSRAFCTLLFVCLFIFFSHHRRLLPGCCSVYRHKVNPGGFGLTVLIFSGNSVALSVFD